MQTIPLTQDEYKKLSSQVRSLMKLSDILFDIICILINKIEKYREKDNFNIIDVDALYTIATHIGFHTVSIYHKSINEKFNKYNFEDVVQLPYYEEFKKYEKTYKRIYTKIENLCNNWKNGILYTEEIKNYLAYRIRLELEEVIKLYSGNTSITNYLVLIQQDLQIIVRVY